MMSTAFPLITVLGPTAVGKTTFAAHLAFAINGEIISADSRQVFREMDIGTGKDLLDYNIDGHIIISHLIDIADPGTEYSVFQFQSDFKAAYTSVISKGKTPVMCGGTGLYLESVLLGYNLNEVPVNEVLRQNLSGLSDNDLVNELTDLRPLHNTTDILDRERLIRAIEIEKHNQQNSEIKAEFNFRNTPVIGIRFERKLLRDRITARLTQRLSEGMVEEIKLLLDKGISKERLMYYGLEYKYVTLYLSGEISYKKMFELLNTAIHQFAKRQMTWYRRMEKKGITIFWIDGEAGITQNLGKAISFFKIEQH
jgi:tRNA dimethylallyltransferase